MLYAIFEKHLNWFDFSVGIIVITVVILIYFQLKNLYQY